jgi:hypothetical protein
MLKEKDQRNPVWDRQKVDPDFSGKPAIKEKGGKL